MSDISKTVEFYLSDFGEFQLDTLPEDIVKRYKDGTTASVVPAIRCPTCGSETQPITTHYELTDDAQKAMAELDAICEARWLASGED